MPNRPRTPHRTIRVPDDVWAAAMAVAARRGETLSDAIRRFLDAYARGQGSPPSQRQPSSQEQS